MADIRGDSDSQQPSSAKKSKRHKTKSSRISDDMFISDPPAPTGAVTTTLDDTPPSSSSSLSSSKSKSAQAAKKRKKRDSATSSDEERWLTAIESGKLEDVDDELKKIKPKDPSLMTARQRAMYDRGVEGGPAASTPALMSLPTGYKEKVMTAEAIQKAAIKSQKRKQLADEKRELDKKKTMEKLLKKQESKAAKTSSTSRAAKANRSSEPCVLYQQSVARTTITFPEQVGFPLRPTKIGPAPPQRLCGIAGCRNPRKYSCSQTGISLCSLECYKKNISSRIL